MLAHYTIGTGHLRASPRDEVTVDLSLLADQLLPGEHPMPGFPGHSVRTTVAGLTLACTAFQGPVPLVTVFVCLDEDGLTEVLRLTGTRPPTPLWLPACLVQVHETIMLAGESARWVGDWERCLAWAWVERHGT